MTAILTVQELEKGFGTREVLRGVSFAVHERDRIGLIGINGSGKSTLLKMMVAGAIGGAGVGVDEAKILEPDAGLITWRRELSLEYVPQEPRLDKTATIADTLQRNPDIPAHEIRGLSAALELPPADKKVGELSIGEGRRVALARALLARPDLLALDEPTNHLDARTVEWLEERLRTFPGALVVVTHDRYFLDRVATRILELDRGSLYSYDGDYTEFLLRQADRLANEFSQESARKSFIRRELDWIRRGPSARGTKQKARIERFDAAVSAAPGEGDKLSSGMNLRLPTGGRLGGTILELENVGRSINGKRLFSDLTLKMKPGDRIGIVGPNGAGKSTLIRTILGIDPPDEGRVTVGKNTNFAYLEQGRTELNDTNSVIEEIAEGNDQVFLEDGPVHVRTFLRMMAFADATGDTKIGSLSGGERNRVQLAKLLKKGGNLIVLDEPTNDLDLATLGVLEQALCDFKGCVLVVSHDRWFLDRVATGVLALEGDGKVWFNEGGYTLYQEKRKARAAEVRAVDPKPAKPAASAPRDKAPGPRKLSFKEKQELAGIEATIQAAETEVEKLEALLSDPTFFKDRAAEAKDQVAALDRARATVETLYARWQELEALSEERPKDR